MRHLLRSLALVAATSAIASADGSPDEGLINFETPHVSPLALTPNGQWLLAVNTPMGTLEVFDASSGTPTQVATIPVGLDPVSVRAASNGQAWVVNHVSDSVSVVDLANQTVIATLETANEPADVVFAGSPLRAFVTCSEANLIQVFDPANLGAAPLEVPIAGEEPRALAVSPDGQSVYAAIFESGNRTITLNGRVGPISTGEGLGSENVVSRPEGPYGGQNPAPNAGSGFSPSINTDAGTPPRSSIIVREDASGSWMDDNGGDWSIFVDGGLASVTRRVPGWGLSDHDIAVIDSSTLGVAYETGLMNMVMAIGVRPTDGRVTAVGTEATNEVRFEPNINGTFLRVLAASFGGSGGTELRDINPHLDYSTSTVSQSLRQQSIGDPRGIAWRSTGSSAFVTGMGSGNVIEIAPDGSRLRTIDVGQGPTGIVLAEGTGRVHVLNKFAGSISSFDLATGGAGVEVSFYDPTPAVIKDGRPFLYDTHLTSGLGHISCASCHVDARTDRLAWDLGDPSGPAATDHPMKGPMLSQSLVDIISHPRMHWRGDRPTLAFFNPAFVGLMGAEAPISNGDMDDFEAFLDTIHFPPNPYRNLDNSRPATVLLPDGRTGVLGQDSMSACISCHLNGGTRTDTRSAELDQDFIGSSFHGFYERLGYRPDQPLGSTSGFGYFHDGADPLFVAGRGPNRVAEILTMDGPGGLLSGNERRQDVHAGVGRQLTVSAPLTATQANRLNQFLAIADGSVHAALIVKGRIAGEARGLIRAGGQYTSDRAGQSLTHAQLLASAEGGSALTWTLVAEGTQTRLGIDRDLDGILDGDEDPIPLVSIASVSVTEGAGTALVSFSLSVPHSEEVSVTFETLSGSATAFEDFVPYSDRIRFDPGEQLQTAAVTILNDGEQESTETLGMRIFDPYAGQLGTATAQITILDDDDGSGNQPPSVDAGPDFSAGIEVPFSLNGTVLDDGASPVDVLWSKVQGPGGVNFGLIFSEDSPVTFYVPGTYVLRLTADDGQSVVSDDLVVDVTFGNNPPEVEAGPNFTVDTDVARPLEGSVQDDGLLISIQWEKLSGPGGVNFTQIGSATSPAIFYVPGTYELRLTADDGQSVVSDEVTVVVTAPGTGNPPPVVDAGPNLSAQVDLAVQLQGSVTDDDPVDISWSKVSGPGAVNFGLIFEASSPATFYVPGTYVLRLTADDGTSQVSDEVTVVVSP